MDPLFLQTRVGSFQVTLLQDGHYRLDGGAMFGVVPKVVWEKRYPADELNRIRMGLDSLLVRTPDALVLVEAGIGSALGEKEVQMFAVEQPHPLPGRLRALGVAPEDIDHVVLTHLNFDHIGHCTKKLPEGTFAPTFPKARYHVQEEEMKFALDPPRRLRASYPLTAIEPVTRAGLWDLHRGEKEIVPGIRLLPTGGHTPGHQVVLVESEGETLVFWGDLVPTSRHLDPGYGMAYDLFPLVVLEQRTSLVGRAADEGWIHTFPHEPEMHFLRVKRGKKYFETEPIEPA